MRPVVKLVVRKGKVGAQGDNTIGNGEYKTGSDTVFLVFCFLLPGGSLASRTALLTQKKLGIHI